MREENYNVEDMLVDKLDEYLCEVTKKDKDDKVGIIKSSDRKILAVDASSAGEMKNCSDDSDIIWNPYGMHNVVLVSKLTEIEEINNELKAKVKKLSIENNDLRETVHLKEKDVAAKDKQI